MPQRLSDDALRQANIKLLTDPVYQDLSRKAKQTKAPADWYATQQRATQLLPEVLGGGARGTENDNSTYHVNVDTGQIEEGTHNSRYNSPQFWGPIAVGAASGLSALGAWGGGGAGAIDSAGESAAQASAFGGANAAPSAGLGSVAGQAGTAADVGGIFPSVTNTGISTPLAAASDWGPPAASTVAGGGGAVAPVVKSASTLSKWLAPILNYAVPVAGSLIGAKMQSNAIGDAADIQAKSMDKALAAEKERQDYYRGQYADYLNRLKPYNQAGERGLAHVDTLLQSNQWNPR